MTQLNLVSSNSGWNCLKAIMTSTVTASAPSMIWRPQPVARQRQPGPAQRRQHDQDRIFRDPVERQRRDETGGDAADGAAGRHPEIEDGEMAGRRPPPRQLAVADQRVDEEHRAMQPDDADDDLDGIEIAEAEEREDPDRIEDQHADQRQDEERLQARPRAGAGSAAGAGTRSRRSRDRARAAAPTGAAPPPRRSRCGRSPRSAIRPARLASAHQVRPSRQLGAGAAAAGAVGSAAAGRGAPARVRHNRAPLAMINAISTQKPTVQSRVWALERDQRLDHGGIGEQRQEAADIAGRIEKIGIAGVRMVGAREPGLQQRPVGGEREERQPDRCREQAEQPEDLAVGRAAGRSPMASGRLKAASPITARWMRTDSRPGR